MSPTLSRILLPEPESPGQVILILSGAGPDLATLWLVLEAITKGKPLAETLRDLDLAAVTITSTHIPHGRTDRMYLTVQLGEAP